MIRTRAGLASAVAEGGSAGTASGDGGGGARPTHSRPIAVEGGEPSATLPLALTYVTANSPLERHRAYVCLVIASFDVSPGPRGAVGKDKRLIGDERR
jgi:hypothetical protein